MKFSSFFFFVLTVLFFEFCVAQPFTPIPLGGKTKKQNLVLPLPATTSTTGCVLVIGATNAVQANGVTTVSLGTTGTRTTSQFTATKDAVNVTSTTAWNSSDPTVASISALGLVTALRAGTTQVGPVCDPTTRVEVRVTAGAVPNTLEIKTTLESNNQTEPEKNKDIQNED